MSLRRVLSFFEVTLAGVGMIVGAGIYALIGVAAKEGGNAAWLSFLISAGIALLTALSYAELSSKFKGNAGEYSYLTPVLGKHVGQSIGFLMILAGIISASTVALGFGGYIEALVGFPLLTSAIGLLLVMSIVNAWGIKQSSLFNVVSTIIEFVGLAVIIGIGITHIGDVNLFEMPKQFTGVISGAAVVFFAFMGFESMIKFREETKEPQKTIPKAIVYSVLITAVLYVLVAIAAVSVSGWQTLASSDAPLASVAAQQFGPIAFLAIGIIALFSTSNTVLMTMVTTSRMMYGMARRKSLPTEFESVHQHHGTPVLAVLAVLLVSILFAWLGEIELVANLTNLVLFAVFIAVNVSLLLVRYKFDRHNGEFRAPFNIGRFSMTAFLGVVTSIAMFVYIIVGLI